MRGGENEMPVRLLQSHGENVRVPGVDIGVEEEDEDIIVGCQADEELLGEQDAKTYISVGALLNYISPDRPELQYSVKEVMRKCSAPRSREWHYDSKDKHQWR